MLVSMGSRNVGKGEPVYLVFEAGPTHNGLESALALVRHASGAGANAIKFQIADHNRLITTKELPFSYGVLVDRASERIETITEPLIDIWRRRHMSHDEWRQVKALADDLAIDFFATTFFEEDADFLIDIGVHSLKVASQDVEHEDLIRYCARKGLPIQLDTGSATIGEVERAVDWVRAEGNEQIIINHCPSGYPARLESINLKLIATLKQMFPEYPIAFSDHTPGWEMDIAARAMGADIIEKTVTLDREFRSCEHAMSIEPSEMASFVASMHALDKALGISRRIISDEQKQKAQSVKRSGFLVRSVSKGEKLRREDVDFRRPGYGVVRPSTYKHYEGRSFAQDLPVGHMVSEQDLM